MRYLTLLVAALLTHLFQPCLDAQTTPWFANSDVWTFHVSGGFAGFDHDFQLKATGDSTINGRACREISPVSNNPQVTQVRYAYADGDQVFAYQPALDSFVVLYDFSLTVGEQLLIPTLYQSVFRYRIDEIGAETVAGVNRRFQRVSELSPDGSLVISGPFYFYEGIGMIHKPVQGGQECSYLFLDESPFCQSFVDGLDVHFVCYAGAAGSTDASGQTCTTSTGEPAVQSLSVRPNPASDYLQVDNLTTDEHTVARIFNVQGQCVFQSRMTTNYLTVNQLQPGVYVLEVQSGDGVRRVGRWVKM